MMVKVAEAYLVMEMVDGKPRDVRPPTDMMDILDTFIQAAQGLKSMQQMGWAHCDIKPNNILRNERGQVKGIDFGHACKIVTIKERIQGTPDYILPGQANREPIKQSTA